MNDKQILNNMKQMYEKKKELQALSVARQAEEQALVVEYKVDECNAKRRDIINKYQAQMQAIQDEIKQLEESLGEKL